MKKASILIFIYALLVLVGGIIGHYKAASTASLISGIIFGIALASSAWLAFRRKIVGVYAGLGLAFALELFFIYRFTLSWKFMPAGMMAIISFAVALALLFFLRRHIMQKKETK